MFMISAMTCGGTAASFMISDRRFDSLASQLFYNVKLFAIDYRASVDAGLARTKCFYLSKLFLFGKIHFLNRFI